MRRTLFVSVLSMLLVGLMAPGATVHAAPAFDVQTTQAADPTDRVLQILEDEATGGTVGLYLKEVSGPILGAHNETFVFEPASTIKALIHFHAMRQVQDGAVINGQPVTLNTQVPWFMDQTGSCPDLTGPASDTLAVGLMAMMQPSDNRWTQAMRDFFGDANINGTRLALGMNDTGLNHSPLGCGPEAAANPNQLTLVDAGLLYEGVATGFLVPPTRDAAYSLMLTDAGDFNTIIDQEAIGLGLSSSSVDDFKAARRSAIKAGSYTLNGLEYRSDAGWIKLPFLDGSCADAPREYVFGVFIHGATALAADNIRTIGTEVLREQIRAALESWDACADFEAMSKVDSPDPVLAGEQVTYTITIRNNGPSEATATVNDLLPADLSLVSCVAAQGLCSGVGNDRTVTFSDVPDGGARTITLVALVGCSVPDGTFIDNTATVTSSKIDGDSGNDSAMSTTAVANPAPVIDATVGIASLWPVDHSLVNVGLEATADDGACPPPTAFDVSVFSNEDDYPPQPPHSPDAKDIGLQDLRLRSERSGDGDGRVYLIVVAATDEAGQSGFGTVTAVVPISQSSKDMAAVEAEAAAARAFADGNDGNPPPGYFVVGDGPELGAKQ